MPSRGISHAITALVATTVGVLPFFLFGGLAPIIRRDLGFDASLIGVLSSFFFAAAAIASVPGGRLGDRLGSQRTLRIGIATSAVVLFGIATLATSWQLLALLLVVGGCANAIIQPAANRALARGVRANRQGFAFGVKQAAIPVASALGGIAVPLVGLTLGWRAAFLVGAALALATFPMPRPDGSSTSRSSSTASIRELPRPLVFTAVGIGLATAPANSLSAYLVEALVTAGWDVGRAGTLLALGSLTSIVSRVLVGYLSDRLVSAHLLVIGLMMLGGAVGFALLGTGIDVLLYLGVGLAFGSGWGMNGLLIFAVVRLSPDTPASTTGITMAAAFTGAIVGPALFGLLAQATTYPFAWAVASVSIMSGGLLVIVAHRMVMTAAQPAVGEG